MKKMGLIKLICFLSISISFSRAETEADVFVLFSDDQNLHKLEDYVEFSTDACNSTADCNDWGECIQIAGRNECDCPNGLSGETCGTIDECVENEEMCGNEPDVIECSYDKSKERAYCKCKQPGMRYDVPTRTCVKQRQCSDHEECQNGGWCPSVGQEVEKKYCHCHYGMSGDFCERIEECVSNRTMCGDDAECRFNSKALRVSCYCKNINQRFDWSSKSCVNRSECRNNEECGSFGSCIDHWPSEEVEEKQSCHCLEGISGQKCEVIDDCFNNVTDCGTGDDVVCDFNKLKKQAYCKCTNSSQKFDEKDKTCKECDCGPKSKECSFKRGKKTCLCESDAINYGDRCEDCKCGKGTKSCSLKNGIIECICEPGYKLLNGTCEKCDCGKNSTDCVFDANGKKVCSCEPGFTTGNYSVCTPMCDDRRVCANGGQCLQDICICLPGTGGPYCEINYNCKNKHCGDRNDAFCAYDELTQRAYCQCHNRQQKFDSYSGYCKECSCDGHSGMEVPCDFILGKKECLCPQNYAYNPKVMECSECHCGNNSKSCSFNKKGEKVCLCLEGHIQNSGVCKECDCGANGNCSFNSNGTQKCLCDAGFSEKSGKCTFCYCGPKSRCSFENNLKWCACAKGYKDNAGYCTDIDECLNAEACPGPGTLCENTLGSYKCRCQLGYQGRSPTLFDRKTLCEPIVETGPNYTPWKIGYGLLSAGFILIIIGLVYVIFRPIVINFWN